MELDTGMKFKIVNIGLLFYLSAPTPVASFPSLNKVWELEALTVRNQPDPSSFLKEGDLISKKEISFFKNQIENKLSKFINLFQEASQRFGVPWKLLAAIGYQESRLESNSVSFTGVKGIMMLTRDTAAFLGVRNRKNPRESIIGGARYFKYLWGRVGKKVTEPDRTWITLASYNVGIGHVEDIQRLAGKL